MFEFCVRKMMRNKWMVACLLIGFIISTAVITCIPIYTGSILHRMLIKDMEARQEETGLYPGNYSVTLRAIQPNMQEEELEKALDTFFLLEKKIDEDNIASLGVPVVVSSKQYRYVDSYVKVVRGTSRDRKEAMNLTGRKDLFDHCSLIAGKFPSSQKNGEIIEVMLTEEGLNFFELSLGDTFDLTPYKERYPAQKLKVVGVYTYKDPGDLYWNSKIEDHKKNAMMDFGLFQDLFVEGETPLIDSANWYYTFDYHDLQMDQVSTVTSRLGQLKSTVGEDASVVFKALEVFRSYTERHENLNMTLQVLLAPVTLMLFFYIFMVSSLIMEHEKNDIALLKSRGANNLQIFSETIMKNGIIALVAVVPGTLAGIFICKVLGLSNGFMELVGRKNINVDFHLNSSYFLGLFSVFMIGFLAIMIPAVQASRMSIVEYKRKKGKFFKGAWWQKIGIDFILIAVSAYLIYNYTNMSRSLSHSDTGMLSYIDPALFLINALLILGLGLLFLRVFPYLIKLIFLIGKRAWSPQLYASFLSVSRSKGKDQFIILFIILTVALAMFHATAARTLNTFMEDRVNYAVGTDMVLGISLPYQDSYYKVAESEEGEETKLEPASPDEEGYLVHSVTYLDIPFQPFEEIKGVGSATKVFQKPGTTVSRGSDDWNDVQLMGITPHEFAKVAWMRSDLLPYHINEYLNLLAEDPRMMLLSSSMKERGLKVGDEIQVAWKDQPYAMDGIVAGFVDYWPSFNPVKSDKQDTETDPDKAPALVIANYSLIQAQMRLEPYEIWLSLDGDITHAEVYQDIQDKKLPVAEVEDAGQQIIQIKNDPMLQGINGSLTLSFVITLAISFIGFLIFWILNLKERTLQFGVLRAMGLSRRSLLLMLGCEQLMITGGAVAAGILIGLLVNKLTIPLLQYLYAPSEQVPPFSIYMDPSDYVKIFVVIALMILFGVLILGRMISKIKIDQALKLGED